MVDSMLKDILVKHYSIELRTGMHIGGGQEKVGIGGADSPVITVEIRWKDRDYEVPYIPGSSIKGRMRSLLELKYFSKGDFDNLKDPDMVSCKANLNGKKKLIGEAFGCPRGDNSHQMDFVYTRFSFSDFFLSEDTMNELVKREQGYYRLGTEIKAENSINRGTGRANPRFIERAVPQLRFEGTIGINVFEGDKEEDLIELLKEGIDLLEKSYLGGSGSRGYGRIHVEEIQGR
ncbi:type III-A CRISPR-associated RAMP protein Csm3 [Thermoplasma sp. Kam2015]|uniref:type III-A CRISPR-associated RAMP protein Csm3 n=1 Tax=Thermoplasma sp. Kam2015 TaxID=2094122 RepID=UPI001293F9BE|nr:type III-A CRISPR-associated RAMP protein Csm3 [Thermoplasma sp. Kam2015]